jgi:PAS domain S-box-containing protein
MQRAPERSLHVLSTGEPGVVDAVSDDPTLEDDRWQVTTARSASEGLAVLADADVDCVVSADDLADRDGIAFLKRVRERYPELPFVLVAEDGSERLASEAVAAGVTEYVPRPDERVDLAARVRAAVDGDGPSPRHGGHDDSRLGRVYERITDGFFAVNRDWRYTYVNDEGARLVGESKEDLLGERVWDAFPGLVGTPFEDALRTAMATQETVSIEEHYEPHDTWYDISVYPSERGISIYFQDVTERKERERELQLERNRFRALFENLGEPVVEAVFEDGEPIIERVNEAFADAFGVGGNVRGRPLDDLVVSEDDETAAEINERARRGTSIDREVYRGTDDVRPYLLRSAPFGGPDGCQRGHAIYIDISDQKARERRLERQNERLDEFASIVSHDIRNPLNTLELSLGLVETDDGEHVERCRRAVDRIDRILEGLATLARQGAAGTETEPVALASLAADCWESVGTAAGTLAVETERVLEADDRLLEQLLKNLLRNAVEHAGNDVTVTIGDADGGFYVADDGPGIPAEERTAVFKRGYSSESGETGYGLVIAREIANAYGWQVAVTESRDGGARFEITGVDADS